MPFRCRLSLALTNTCRDMRPSPGANLDLYCPTRSSFPRPKLYCTTVLNRNSRGTRTPNYVRAMFLCLGTRILKERTSFRRRFQLLRRAKGQGQVHGWGFYSNLLTLMMPAMTSKIQCSYTKGKQYTARKAPSLQNPRPAHSGAHDTLTRPLLEDESAGTGGGPVGESSSSSITSTRSGWLE